MKLKGVLLLDCEFNPIEIPSIYTVDDWDNLILNTDYIFLADDAAVAAWNENVMRWDSYTKSPFYKEGAYMWDTVHERWIHMWDKVGELRGYISKVGTAYAQTQKPVWSDVTEE